MSTDDEILDIVNLQDQVVGQEKRATIHANGLLHRAVHIFIQNQQGHIFLQKRSMIKDIHPGLWTSSCCGHVDQGETYDQAAYRELKEELGISLSQGLHFVLKDTPSEENTHEFIHIYTLQHDGPFVLHPEEIDDSEWISTQELNKALKENPVRFTPALKRMWEYESLQHTLKF